MPHAQDSQSSPCPRYSGNHCINNCLYTQLLLVSTLSVAFGERDILFPESGATSWCKNSSAKCLGGQTVAIPRKILLSKLAGDDHCSLAIADKASTSTWSQLKRVKTRGLEREGATITDKL